MDENWGSIIKKLRLDRGWTQEDFANKSGLKRSHISRIELNEIKQPTKSTFETLARTFDMSLQELSTVLSGGKIPLVSELGRPSSTKGERDTLTAIPVYPEFRFHAPGGIEAPTDYVYLMKNGEAGKNIAAFIIEGNCMSPVINDSDYIVVDADADINSGDIVACKINDELYVGKLRKFDGEFWLENKDKRFRMVDCQTIAKVIQITRKM